jgi:hypothetical protein
MNGAVFLSASVPDPKRAPEYAATAETAAITAAVSSLLYVTLGRRRLVWGGHPAITPMIWVVAQEIGVDYGAWIRLYQSRYFEDDFPEENARFQNVTYTEAADNGRENSLRIMRKRMFSDNLFDSAVFIGGMGGVVDEFRMLHELQPTARVLPIVSTGGASLRVAEQLGTVSSDLWNDLDYVALFHRHLQISVHEERFRSPGDQPREVDKRLWQPPKPRHR